MIGDYAEIRNYNANGGIVCETSQALDHLALYDVVESFSDAPDEAAVRARWDEAYAENQSVADSNGRKGEGYRLFISLEMGQRIGRERG